jgi:hypothetical protein
MCQPQMAIINHTRLRDEIILYRVVQKEKSITWEVTVSRNLRKKFIWTVSNFECLPRYSCWNLVFTFSLSPVCGDCGVGQRAKFKLNAGHTTPIAGLHFGCCCLYKETWRSTETNSTRFCTRFAKCFGVDGVILEHLLWTVTNLAFLCNKFYI